jgi:Uma2 family endonuclease
MSALATAPPLSPTTGLMTVDEFWEFVHRPENEHRNLDLIRGVVVEMSRPNRVHGIVTGRLTTVLTLWSDRHGVGYIATADSGVILGQNPDTIVGPDVAYYTDATRPEEVPEKWGDVAPVLAVEVQSPSDRPGKINAKVKEYLDAGTKQVWQVDPEEKMVTVHRPNQGLQIFKLADTLTGDPDLPGFSCRVADLFRLPGEPAPQPPAAP